MFVKVESSGWTQGLVGMQPTAKRAIFLQPFMLVRCFSGTLSNVSAEDICLVSTRYGSVVFTIKGEL